MKMINYFITIINIFITLKSVFSKFKKVFFEKSLFKIPLSLPTKNRYLFVTYLSRKRLRE